MSTFYHNFLKIRKDKQSVLCIGLDPDPVKLPEGYDQWNEFFVDIVNATSDLAVAYKPNLAFFEAMGPEGMTLFAETVNLIQEKGHAIIIADAKRADIGNTARFYARAFYEIYGCNAITVSPYMGRDSIEPFLESDAHAAMVLCLTSNDGSLDFQHSGNPPLFEKVAALLQSYAASGKNVWAVVGATRDATLIGQVRKQAPDVPFLVPGVGAQGGDEKAVLNHAGADVLINSSRNILYAESHRSEVMKHARDNAGKLVESMRKAIYLG